MAEENINLDYALKKIDETRKCFLVEIKQKDLMSKKHRRMCATSSYIEHLLIIVSAGCFSISVFASLNSILVVLI